MGEFCQESGSVASCPERRQFLVRAGVTAGGMVLSLSSVATAESGSQSNAPSDELVIKLSDQSPLSKAGGSQTFDTKAGKVIVIHNAEGNFAAYSAVCPHKGGPLQYEAESKEFSCPWHGSRFDAAGKVVNGPARQGLTPYHAQTAVVIGLTPSA